MGAAVGPDVGEHAKRSASGVNVATNTSRLAGPTTSTDPSSAASCR